MDKKKLLSLLGSAVVFGLGTGEGMSAQAGEGKCGGMKMKEKQGQMREATCGGMKEEKKEKEKKSKEKQKEMACGGNMNMKKGDS